MLREKDVRYVDELRSLLGSDKPLEGKVRTRLSRIKDKIEKTIEGLASVARNLPEGQRQQVFTAEFLEDLIDAFLTLDTTVKDSKFVTNIRVFKIAIMLIDKVQSKTPDLISYHTIVDPKPMRMLQAMLLTSVLVE